MADEPQVHQEIEPERDAYTTARDMHVHHHYSSPGGLGDSKSLVVGDVPQEPAEFQPRPGLVDALESRPEGRVSVVYAVTGIRGVGKTQVAAACARRRIADRWRLVAWVDASDENALLGGLADVADAAGIGNAETDAQERAAGVRSWLEADGERRLLVFDNANDLAMLRPFLPASGAAQVIVTSSRRSAAGLGTPVPVDVFSEDEALAYLAGRTGLDDEPGARELAEELGYLPLGLAQAASLIARQYLDYPVYLERLRSRPVADYLKPTEADEYPYRLAEAIELSLEAVARDASSGVRRRLMGLMSVLAETGVRRELLSAAVGSEEEADEGLGDLADASLLGFSVDRRSVIAHRLVMRVVRERLASGGGLAAVVHEAIRALMKTAPAIDEAWRGPGAVRDLAGQVAAVMACLTGHQEVITGQMLEGLLLLRLRSAILLTKLGNSTGLAIAAAEPLAADCERLLGADHPDTLTSRSTLAAAYRAAGRTAEAPLAA